MTGEVIILGAKGRFGRAAASAFAQAGWRVRALARRWDKPPIAGAEPVAADAMDASALTAACAGSDVIVNAVNPPYPDWPRVIPALTRNVLAAAQGSGATVMIPGNVYNFGPLKPGAPMPAVLSEDAPQNPKTRKGALRVEMERRYAEAAAQDGVRTLVLRAGDFIEGAKTGNWFDSHMTRDLRKGRFVYPGRTDVAHAWAYLPDLGRAMAALAAKRQAFPAFHSIGFPGYTLTGAEMTAILRRLTGRPLTVRDMPWTMMRLSALVSPLIREVLEMRYLWNEAHEIDGARFTAALPGFQATPVEQALAEAIDAAPRAAPKKKGEPQGPALQEKSA